MSSLSQTSAGQHPPSVALLATIREMMKASGLCALIVPSSDPHESETPCDHFNRRAAITGFKGSAGTALVTHTEALLWTDARYFIIAKEALWPGWSLMKMNFPKVPTLDEFLGKLVKEAGESCAVGVDPMTMSANAFSTLSKNVPTLQGTEYNMADCALSKTPGFSSLPPLPSTKVFDLPVSFSGLSRSCKVERVVALLKERECDVGVYSTLEDLTWLFNIRAFDLRYTPLIHGFAVIDARDRSVTFFVDLKCREGGEAVESLLREELGESLRIEPYHTFMDRLPQLIEGSVVSVDLNMVREGVLACVKAKAKNMKSFPGEIQRLRIVKNQTEQDGFRACHVRDGAALTALLAWVDDHVQRKEPVTERMLADKLAALRKAQDLFVDLSFAPIIGIAGKGAIIHRTEISETACVEAGELLLLDSGGHYKDGTTDCTRTVCFGEPRPEEKRVYTIVLKGLVEMTLTVFPKGTTGQHLASHALLPMWRSGMECVHGTGHGIGHCMGVHELSFIGLRSSPTTQISLQEGMVLSNEPGFYIQDKFGVRVENADMVALSGTPEHLDFSCEVSAETDFASKFLTFVPLNRVPFDPKLIDVDLLTSAEIHWINHYHQLCRNELKPLLYSNTIAWNYVESCTKPLSK